jgi:O-antigen/teichoic acid export membrane protein
MLLLTMPVLDRFVVSAVLLRIWGVSGFEDWSLLLAAAGMLTMVDLGLQATLGNAYMDAYQKGKKDLFNRLISIGIFLMSVIVATSIVSLVLLTAFDGLTSLIKVSTLNEASASAIFLCLGIATVLQTASGAITPIYRAQGRFPRALIMGAALNVARLVALSAVALSGGSLYLAAIVYLVLTTIWVLLLLPWDVLRNLDSVKLMAAIPNRQEMHYVVTVAPWFFAQVACLSIMLAFPLLIIAKISAVPGAIAMFLFLRFLSNTSRQVEFAISNSIGIALSQDFASKSNVATIQSVLLRSTRLISVLSGAILGAVMALVEPLFDVWSGNAVQVDLLIAFTFGLGVSLTAPYSSVAQYLTYIGEARLGAISKVVGLAVAICASVALSVPYGLFGVALGLTIGEIAGFGIIYIRPAAKWTGLTGFRLAINWLGYSALGFVAIVLVSGLSDSLQLESVLLTMLFKAFLICAVVPLVLFWFGMAANDRVAVIGTVTRFVRGVGHQ